MARQERTQNHMQILRRRLKVSVGPAEVTRGSGEISLQNHPERGASEPEVRAEEKGSANSEKQGQAESCGGPQRLHPGFCAPLRPCAPSSRRPPSTSLPERACLLLYFTLF